MSNKSLGSSGMIGRPSSQVKGEEHGVCSLPSTEMLPSGELVKPLARMAFFYPLSGSWSALEHSLECGVQLLGWCVSARSVGPGTPLSG